MTTVPIVGHRVRYDAMGPRISHPHVCLAVRRAVECPHWQALDRGRLVIHGGIERGHPHLAYLDDSGTLHLMPRESVGLRKEIREEIRDFLDTYLKEVGTVDAVIEWLKEVNSRDRRVH